MPSPIPNESPACVQPPALEKRSTCAVKASSLLCELVDQVSHTGDVEVLKELGETLFRLRAHSGRSQVTCKG